MKLELSFSEWLSDWALVQSSREPNELTWRGTTVVAKPGYYDHSSMQPIWLNCFWLFSRGQQKKPDLVSPCELLVLTGPDSYYLSLLWLMWLRMLDLPIGTLSVRRRLSISVEQNDIVRTMMMTRSLPHA